MSNEAVAERYAEALYELGDEHGAVDAFRDQITGVAEAFEESGELRSTLLNPGIGVDERREVVRGLAEAWELDQMVLNFLLLLLDNDRVRDLPAIAEAFRDRIDEEEGNVRATITSAVPLDRGQKRAVKEVLGDLTGKNVVLTTEVDESLIGGAVARVGGRVYDGSVRSNLERLKNDILETV
ncbi:MAG: ATP synthase F1 subunit delta [Bradymonadaceae bacterium]